MSTLMDHLSKFASSYIRKTKESKQIIIEDKLLINANDVNEISERFSFNVDGKKITPELRRRMALTAPFYMKGLKKKCQDTFRSGFTFKNPSNDNVPSEIEQKTLDDFNKRNNIDSFLGKMKQDAHIYGDGVCLITFINDQYTENPDLSKEIRKGAEPYDLIRLDPELFDKFEYKTPYWKKKNIKHLVYENNINGKKEFIHPDRIILFKETDFAFTKFGISDMDILRHVVSSLADIDVATGEILKHFSYGIIQWTKDGADRATMKEMRKIADKHPHIYIGNEKYHLDVHNPEAINPQPFYNYIIMSIAAVLVMPVAVLKGDDSKLEGYVDYYNDIKDSQRIVYRPALIKLYKMLFESKFENKREFDYDIIFNPTYAGEMAEAEIDAKRSATAVNLKTANIADNSEARKYINEGRIYLDPDKKIENIDSNINKEPTQPNPRTEQSIPKKEKEDVSDDNKVKAMHKDMIDKRKLIIEQELGKKESIEQEQRLLEAEQKEFDEIRNTIKKLKGMKNV
jgi:hypothetical protein